jgi:hypothetical protein
MTSELLAVLLLLFVFVFVFVVSRIARRRRGRFAGSSSMPVPTLRVGVARPFEKKKRAALDAASAVLR